MIETIFDIPEYAVVVLKNTVDLSVYVFQSKECLTSIARCFKQLRYGIHPCSKLQVSFDAKTLEMEIRPFEDGMTASYLRAQFGVIRDGYINAGFSDMRDGYTPGKYKLRIEPDIDFRLPRDLLVYVTSMSIRRDREVLGIFESMEEAEAWANSRFPDRSNIIPERHNSPLMHLYYENRHTTTLGYYKTQAGKVKRK